MLVIFVAGALGTSSGSTGKGLHLLQISFIFNALPNGLVLSSIHVKAICRARAFAPQIGFFGIMIF